jgi:hypothetical protein
MAGFDKRPPAGSLLAAYSKLCKKAYNSSLYINYVSDLLLCFQQSFAIFAIAPGAETCRRSCISIDVNVTILMRYSRRKTRLA